jgi:2-dehydropantoate 2-reductase
MRIAVVGAGAVGGYFGGRLLAAGHDVTFVARGRRLAELRSVGLRVRSPAGDLELPKVDVTDAPVARAPYDVVLVCVKLNALDGALPIIR